MKYIAYGIGLFLVGLFIGYVVASKSLVGATQCKSQNANCQNASDKSCCSGLSCQNGHGGYKCRPSTTPRPTATVTATATATASAEPTAEPTKEPEVTQTPVIVEIGLTVAGVGECAETAPAKIPNIFVKNAGVGKLEVRWIPSGGEKAHIFYGLKAGSPEHSLINTPNDGVEVIGGLVSGKHYYFAVTNGSGCSWSSLSNWYDPIVE